MKLRLEEKIQKLIDSYNGNSEKKLKEYKAAIETFKDSSYKEMYTDQGMRQAIKEKLDKVTAEWVEFDTELNDTLQELVKNAKEEIFKKLSSKEAKTKPTDYNLQVSNAIQFLNAELSDGKYSSKMHTDKYLIEEKDEELYQILKEFTLDFDVMKQFRKMVERKVSYIRLGDGSCIFPKTFNDLIKYDEIMSNFNEVENISQFLFLDARTDSGELITVNGLSYSLPWDTYKHRVGLVNIVNYASEVDELFETFGDEEGDGSISYADILRSQGRL